MACPRPRPTPLTPTCWHSCVFEGAMSNTAVRSNAAATDARGGKVDMKLEVVVIPVSDIDRAKKFYGSLGWRLDVTPPGVVQLTPPGSGCSVQFGAKRTSAAPGSAQGL